MPADQKATASNVWLGVAGATFIYLLLLFPLGIPVAHELGVRSLPHRDLWRTVVVLAPVGPYVGVLLLGPVSIARGGVPSPSQRHALTLLTGTLTGGVLATLMLATAHAVLSPRMKGDPLLLSGWLMIWAVATVVWTFSTRDSAPAHARADADVDPLLSVLNLFERWSILLLLIAVPLCWFVNIVGPRHFIVGRWRGAYEWWWVVGMLAAVVVLLTAFGPALFFRIVLPGSHPLRGAGRPLPARSARIPNAAARGASHSRDAALMGLASLLLAHLVLAASFLPGPTGMLLGPLVAAGIGAFVCGTAALVHVGRAHYYTGAHGRLVVLALVLFVEGVAMFFATWLWRL